MTKPSCGHIMRHIIEEHMIAMMTAKQECGVRQTLRVLVSGKSMNEVQQWLGGWEVGGVPQ